MGGGCQDSQARNGKIIDFLPKYSDFGKVPSICTHHKPIDWNLEQGWLAYLSHYP